jgi:FimV-like protein
MSVALKHSLIPLVLVVPTAGFAIGLGDIHVESALNEPLSARIEIVGATPEDLQDLRAAIANREMFQHYGVERPSFLTSTRFKVTHDAAGRPVLQVTSNEAFTEPVVSLLVDLRWDKGELIREYPLLLDPADFATRADVGTRAVVAARTDAAARPDADKRAQAAETHAAAPAPRSPESANSETAPSAEAASATGTANGGATVGQSPAILASDSSGSGRPTAAVYRVASRDTLHAVARRVAKSRNETVLQRTMIALFRANPTAFDGNINRLHRGALLTVPSSEMVASISTGEARTEFHAQMSAWHRKGFFGTPPAAALAAARTPAPAPAPIPAEPANAVAGIAQDNQRSTGARSPSPPLASNGPASNATASNATASNAPASNANASNASVLSASTSSANASNASAASVAMSSAAPAVAAAARSADASTNDSLERRIQALEQALNDTKRILSSEHATLESLQQYVAETASAYPVAPAKAPAAKEADAAEAPEHRLSRGTIWGLLGAAFALVLFTAWKWRAKRAHVPPRFPPVAHEDNLATVLEDSPFAAEFKDRGTAASPGASRDVGVSASTLASREAVKTLREAAKAAPADAAARGSMASPAPAGATSQPPVSTSPKAAAKSMPATSPAGDSGNTTTSLLIDATVGDETVNLAAPTQQIPLDTERLAALNDLERELEASYDPTATDVFEHVPIAEVAARKTGATAQHVQMPGKLTERPVVAQERTNIIDVLKKAIESDPHRLDLRLKLLEIYFASDLAGREEYVEVARKLSRSGEILSASDWEKITALTAHNDSTAVTQEQKVPGKLADCA